jgi:leader peptidase (prepilin peptidase)/N-methyltransferase
MGASFCDTITVMIIVVLAVFGLIFGSFINALTWRFHEQDRLTHGKTKKGKAATQKRLRELSMLHGRSMCSHCGHELAAKDLVPLFSWLYLRGKCRYCGVKIQDNPLVEVVTGLLFAASYIWWPLDLHGVGLFQFIVWLAFVVAFVALAVYDIRWFLLPNRIVFPAIGTAIIEVAVVAITSHDWRFALDAVLGGIIIYGIFYLLFQVSGGNWIGGGDVKLALALGLLAGTPVKALLVIFFASVIGTLFSVPQLLKGRKGLQVRVPFGPFLLAATVLVVLFGTSIVNWYTGLLG